MEFNPSYASAISNAWNHTPSKCLLCPNLVNVTEEIVFDRKVILNLIHHMQLDIDELPEICTGKLFPFCLDCKSVLLSVSKLNDVIERSLRRIEIKTKKIEKSVMDGEIMGPQPGTSSMMIMENQRFSILPEAVLRAYKGKLFQKREQQEVEMGIHSQMIYINQEDELDLQNAEEVYNHADTEIEFSENVPTNNIPETPPSFTETQDVSEAEEDEIYALTMRKRKVTFHGVEMLQAEGTGVLKDKIYTQCSLCDFSVEKENSRKDTSNLQLKTHILNVHRNISGVPQTRILNCISCNLSFPNYRELQQHKLFHPQPPPLECDICGKPMAKTCKPIHLLHHKFSHKNDDERKVAILACEPGSRTTLLANKLGWGYKKQAKRQQKSGRTSRKTVRVRAGICKNQLLPKTLPMKVENNCERVDLGDGSFVFVKQEHLEMFF